MPEIIANVIVRDGGYVHRFERKVNVPEFPKVGERIWLNIKNKLLLFKVVRRHDMQEDAEAIEFDFKRPLFNSWSPWFIHGVLEDDSRWREYSLDKYGEKKFDTQIECAAA